MSERRPRIGITMYRNQARWGLWDQPADLLPVGYADAVNTAGGVALLLPAGDEPDPAPRAAATVDALDGLVLAGGADIDPARYAQVRAQQTDEPRTDRDDWEFALARAALDRGVPVLGVCRGMQLLNVLYGGTLVQHLPATVGSDLHGPTPGAFAHHRVRVAGDSRITSAVADGTLVATHHHQGIGELGEGLQATAWADDGVVEALELPGAAWVVGVQWHPEAYDGSRLFAAFVSACAHTHETAPA
jgi:putative glutamine amidotransferase